MLEFWTDDLTPEEEEELLKNAANQISKRKLELPAILMLESHKPLAFMGTQAAIAFSPFIAPFLGFDRVNNYTRLFSKRENIERLIQKLEEGRSDAAKPKEA